MNNSDKKIFLTLAITFILVSLAAVAIPGISVTVDGDPDSIEVSNESDLRRVGSGETYAGKVWSLDASYVQTNDIVFDSDFYISRATLDITPVGNDRYSVNAYIDNYSDPDVPLSVYWNNGIVWTELSTDQSDVYYFDMVAANSISLLVKDDAGFQFYVAFDTSAGSLHYVFTGNMHPIGSKYSPFTGEYDGNGHIINGLEIITSYNGTGSNIDSNVGLFSYLNQASVRDLGMYGRVDVGQTSPGSVHVGAIAGYAMSSKIEGCYNSAIIVLYGQDNTWYAGGIAGGINSAIVDSYVKQCFNYGRMFFAVGGANPQMSGITLYAGGIAGESHVKISECYNESQLDLTTNSYIVTGGAGGIVGISDNETSNCYNVGSMNSNSYTDLVCGGIVGIQDGALISNCYVAAYFYGGYNHYIGVVGAGDNNAQIVNCYYRDYLYAPITGIEEHNSGEVTEEDLRTTDYSSVFNQGVTTINQSQTVYGWDFGNIWALDSEYVNEYEPGFNNGFPLLRCFLVNVPLNVNSASMGSIDLTSIYSTFDGMIEAIPENGYTFGAWTDLHTLTTRQVTLTHWRQNIPPVTAVFTSDSDIVEVRNVSDYRKIGSGIVDARGVWGLNANYVQTEDIYFDEYSDAIEELTVRVSAYYFADGSNEYHFNLEILIDGNPVTDGPDPSNNLKANVEGIPVDLRDGRFAGTLLHENYYEIPSIRIFRHSNVSDIDVEIEFGIDGQQAPQERTYKGTAYPIAGATGQFNGTYDGRGHVISGLNFDILDPVVSNCFSSIGMFAVLGDGSSVSNLGMINGQIKVDAANDADVGAIAGTSYGGMITGCYNANSIKVYGASDWGCVGGLVGSASSGDFAGISSCFNIGVIECSSFTGDVGGIVGNSSCLVSECYNNGDMIINAPYDNSYQSVGGIIGSGQSVTDSYNTGSIIVSDNNDVHVGGIAGNASMIVNCYNIGTLDAPTSVGSIVGEGYELFNCYYPRDTYDISGFGLPDMYYDGSLSQTSLGAKTVDELMTTDISLLPYYAGQTIVNMYYGPLTVDGWDFDNIWAIDLKGFNNGYPILRSFISSFSVATEPADGGSVEGEIEFYSTYNGWITAVPSSGYVFVGWNSGETFDILEFNIPHWKREIRPIVANFSLISSPTDPTYSIYAYSDENSTITPGVIRVRAGENATFNFEAAEGYSIVSVIIDGVDRSDLADTGIIEFSNVTDNHIVSITSEPVEIWLTLNIRGKGTVNYSYQENINEYSGPVLIDYGSTVTLYAVAADRSVFKEWGSSSVDDTNETVIVISNITSSLSIGVVFGAPDGSLDLSPEDEFTLFIIITAINIAVILALIALALKVGLSAALFELGQLFGIKRTYKVTAIVIGAAAGVAIVCAHRIERNGHCNFKIKKDGEFLVDEGLNSDPTRITDNYHVEYHMGDGEWASLTDVNGEYMIPKVKGKIEIRLTYKGGVQ